MSSWSRILMPLLTCLALGIGCAPAGPSDAGGAVGSSAPRSAATVKRITLGTELEQDLHPGVSGRARVVVPLVHSGLTVGDDQRLRRPLLAEAVPSLDNGLWKLLPDGRMETTWRLREGARWHDGAPLTTADLLFTLRVRQDRAIPGLGIPEAFGEATAPDPRTLIVAWNEPFIDADELLDTRAGPLPRHLLEEAYRADRASLLALPYWTSEFVGAGPYRLREVILGIGMLLEANGEYALGRPRIDLIEVKYLPDANTLMASLLAGTVDVTHAVGSVDIAIQLRGQWRGGTVAFNFGSDNWVALFPQFVDPRPAIVADRQVRRALAHAIDRQEIVDTLVAGMSPVPHSFLPPGQEAYRDIEATVPRYEYDPRRAAQLLEARGYRKGADGTYRDEANRRLELEVRSGPLPQSVRPALAIADYWQQLGVDATPVHLSTPQFQDPQYAATFPAFSVFGGPNGVDAVGSLHSRRARLPGNDFRVPGAGNWSRYTNPEFDALIDRYRMTMPVPERTQVLGETIRHIAQEVTLLGLHYNPAPGAISNRLVNVSTQWPGVFITWNAHEWELRS